MEGIHKIIYNSTRELHSIENKIKIATIFIFCYKSDRLKFANLLYNEDYISFSDKLNKEFKEYDVDFSLDFSNKNIENSFLKTRAEVIRKFDDNGFLKALHEGDSFAIAICEILKYDFTNIDALMYAKQSANQLTLF